MKTVCINNREIGHGKPCYLIAEIGINHNGNIAMAKQLIQAAKKAGFEAVKFQKRTVDVVYTQNELAAERESPFGHTNGDLKRGLEFSKEAYAEIDAFCKKEDITWFASPWDEKSVDFLEEFHISAYKIASASLTDDGLLRHIRATGKPIIASVGMSSEAEIEHAVEVLGQDHLVLLHTVSTYPAKDEHVNLASLQTLQKKYPQVPVGYSGHELGTVLSVAAATLGACVVERHISMDKTMWGSDQKASIEPAEMMTLAQDIRRVECAFGDGRLSCIDAEIPVRDKLRRK